MQAQSCHSLDIREHVNDPADQWWSASSRVHKATEMNLTKLKSQLRLRCRKPQNWSEMLHWTDCVKRTNLSSFQYMLHFNLLCDVWKASSFRFSSIRSLCTRLWRKTGDKVALQWIVVTTWSAWVVVKQKDLSSCPRVVMMMMMLMSRPDLKTPHFLQQNVLNTTLP